MTPSSNKSIIRSNRWLRKERGAADMKRILMIGTGGTIASGETEDGLSPALSPKQLLQYVPKIAELCEVDCVSPFSIDSTNITPKHWHVLTEIIRDTYHSYDGFVISHGTDTMAYTAAALSYMIQHAEKPIILTGAQKPISFDSTDSKLNLTDAFVCACSEEISGVCIVFSGRVILGTRARKTCSKSFTAFSSINYPDLATLQDHRLMCYIPGRKDPPPAFYETLNTRVGLLKLVPGMDADLLRFALERQDAVILECFGVGGLPSYGNNAILQAVEEATAKGKYVVMTTQVQNEGSDLSVYQVGHSLRENPNILEAYDMTTEAAFAKLMWILGQSSRPERVRNLFYTPVAHDLLHR